MENQQQQEINKEMLMTLLAEAAQVTAMSSLWVGNLPSNDQTDIALTKYYFKWIDVAKLAVENLDENTPVNVKALMADDLVRLITVPLRGMQEAIQAYAKQLNVVLPVVTPAPNEVFAYKQWALDYVSKCMAVLKEVKEKERK
jgi:hypothetical protein